MQIARKLLILITGFFFLFLLTSSLPGNLYASEKRIEVNLTEQRLYAIEDENKIYDFPVSTGKPWWSTPTGDFRIWIKLRFKNMRGGSKKYGTYYYLPNVPYTMFFSNDSVSRSRGYALHGTYWHNNFGHP